MRKVWDVGYVAKAVESTDRASLLLLALFTETIS